MLSTNRVRRRTGLRVQISSLCFFIFLVNPHYIHPSSSTFINHYRCYQPSAFQHPHHALFHYPIRRNRAMRNIRIRMLLQRRQLGRPRSGQGPTRLGLQRTPRLLSRARPPAYLPQLAIRPEQEFRIRGDERVRPRCDLCAGFV